MKPELLISIDYFKTKLYQAFTLAEVLITLGIIGIVAALTIPTLVSTYQEKVLVTQFQEVYSQLSQAYINAAKDNGTADTWSADGQDSYNNLKAYFQVQEDCPNTAGCFHPGAYKDIKGNASDNPYSFIRYKFTLKNGAAFMFDGPNTLFVDTNGKSGPNQFGYDYFLLHLNKQNNSPYVSWYAPGSWADSSVYCMKFGTFPGGWYNGGSCASWVIRHGNMDYLHADISNWAN